MTYLELKFLELVRKERFYRKEEFSLLLGISIPACRGVCGSLTGKGMLEACGNGALVFGYGAEDFLDNPRGIFTYAQEVQVAMYLDYCFLRDASGRFADKSYTLEDLELFKLTRSLFGAYEAKPQGWTILRRAWKRLSY